MRWARGVGRIEARVERVNPCMSQQKLETAERYKRKEPTLALPAWDMHGMTPEVSSSRWSAFCAATVLENGSMLW
jgi:hypothetical protein